MNLFVVIVLQLFCRSRKRGMSPLSAGWAQAVITLLCVWVLVLLSLGLILPYFKYTATLLDPRKGGGRRVSSFLLHRANLLFNFHEKNMLGTLNVTGLIFT